jgi:hypothetical protein
MPVLLWVSRRHIWSHTHPMAAITHKPRPRNREPRLTRNPRIMNEPGKENEECANTGKNTVNQGFDQTDAAHLRSGRRTPPQDIEHQSTPIFLSALFPNSESTVIVELVRRMNDKEHDSHPQGENSHSIPPSEYPCSIRAYPWFIFRSRTKQRAEGHALRPPDCLMESAGQSSTMRRTKSSSGADGLAVALT